MQIVSLGQQVKMEHSELIAFDSEPPYQMVSGSVTLKTDDSVMKIDAAVSDDKLVAKITTAGQERTRILEDFEYTLSDAATLEMHDYANAKIGDNAEIRAFDLLEFTFGKQKYEIKKIKQTVASGVPVKFYEVHFTSEETDFVGKSRISANGEMQSLVIAGVFEARKETEESAIDMGYSADLFLLGSLGVDKPIGEPENVKALELKIKKEVADWVSIGPYQNVEQREGAYVLKLGKAYGEAVTASAEDIALNLKETVTLPISHPVIQKLVKEAVGEEIDPVKKTKKLISFVSDFIEDSLNDNAVSVLDICKNKRGDCSEHSMLFATMARAAGIPCREVGGYIYIGDDVKAFGNHAWNEVVLGGCWVPVDSTWDEFEINPTHIQAKKTGEFQALVTSGRMRLLKKEVK